MVAGELAPDEVRAVDAHLADCAACREFVVQAARAAAPVLAATASASTAPTVPVAPVEPLVAGTRIGRYQVRHVLGRGGMGVVHAAYDPALDREVALKIIRDETAEYGGEVRLVREGQAIARLVHPNVVTVHDIGRDGGRLFIAMELVDGTTLSDWLRERRDWRDVVRVFAAAGRGLAAAHRAGLVHRDFKPANVFLGRDGRVKVGDFGLARLSGAPTTPLPIGGAGVVDPMTSSSSATIDGAMIGTPAYMAPEQITGGACDALSDQFGFATALYEGLYGARPFAGETVAVLRERIAGGVIDPEPPGRAVPRWLRAAVLRGLARDPADRYPTIDAMVTAIERDPRRRWFVAGGAAAAVALVAGVGLAWSASDEPRCAPGELTGVWDAHARLAVERAFVAIGKPFAPPAARQAVGALDRQAAAWSAMKREVCEAAHVRRDQTPAQEGLRLICLDERRRELAAVAAELARIDAGGARRVEQILDVMRPLDRCSDLAELTAVVPPPADPATRAAVTAIEERLRLAELDDRAARWVAGHHKARAIAADAAQIAYPPVRARAWLLAGELAERAGAIAESEPALREAALAADAGRDDRTRVRALLSLAHLFAVTHGKFDDALRVVREAEATIARMGDEPLLVATIGQARGSIVHALGKHGEARAALERTLEVRTRLLPADHRDIALTQTELASVMLEQGQLDRARELLEKSIASRERTLGTAHPDVAAVINRLGNVELQRGDLDAAEAAYRRSLAIIESALPPSHPEIAAALGNLGMVLRHRRDLAQALAVFERARTILDAAHRGPHPLRVVALYNLASIQVARGNHAAARDLLERGRAMLIEVKGERAPERSAFENYLAQIAQEERRWADSQRHLEAALANDIALLGEHHSQVGEDHEALGYHYQLQHQYDRAAQHYARALAVKRATLGAAHPAIATTLDNLGALALDRKRPTEALELFGQALAIEEQAQGADDPDLLWHLLGIGRSELALGRPERALAVLRRALALPNADNLGSPSCSARLALAQALWRTGKRADARALREPTAACFAKTTDTERAREARDWFARPS